MTLFIQETKYLYLYTHYIHTVYHYIPLYTHYIYCTHTRNLYIKIYLSYILRECYVPTKHTEHILRIHHTQTSTKMFHHSRKWISNNIAPNLTARHIQEVHKAAQYTHFSQPHILYERFGV